MNREQIQAGDVTMIAGRYRACETCGDVFASNGLSWRCPPCRSKETKRRPQKPRQTSVGEIRTGILSPLWTAP